jgi:hypothetical protein
LLKDGFQYALTEIWRLIQELMPAAFDPFYADGGAFLLQEFDVVGSLHDPVAGALDDEIRIG